MIRFRQTFGAHAGRTLSFEQPRIRFGRMPDSDVPFDPHADLDASGRHAEARHQAGQWMIVDVGSRNGTWVNGNRVQTKVLVAGDEIEFGHGGPRVLVEAIEEAAAVVEVPTAVPTAAGPGALGNAPTLLAPEGAVPPTMPPPKRDDPADDAVPSTASSTGVVGPKVYGDATAGRMVQDAVAEALQRQRDEARARRLKIGLGCAVLGLAFALGCLVVLFLALR